MLLLCWCEGYTEVMMSEMDAIKVLVANPVRLAVVISIICLLAVMIVIVMRVCAVLRSRRNRRVVPQGKMYTKLKEYG